MRTGAESLRIDVNAGIEAVSIDRVPDALGRAWSNVSRQVEERSGQVPLRTSILNFVVVAHGRTQARLARETLHGLVEQMPSRAIVLEIGRPGTDYDASISAHCHYLTAGRAACYEVIDIRAPSDQLAAIPSLLQQLELYDVPSFMWWVGSFDFDSREFRRLADSADRLIIDSSRFDSALEALCQYRRFLHEPETTSTGTDLNWARATSWRELIAQSFDHPIAQGLIGDIQRVEIAYDPSGEAQAVLIAGWLASRLGWTLVQGSETTGSTRLRLRNARDGQVNVNLNLQASSGAGLRAVRILTGSGSRTARITVRRHSEDLSIVAIEAAGMARQERIVRDRRPHLYELIGKELLIQTRDPVFDASIDVVAEIVQTLRESE